MPTLRGTRKRLSDALAGRLGSAPTLPSISLLISPQARQPSPEPENPVSLVLQGPGPCPDHASFEASADPQDSSPLFNVLPPEVRELVYGYMFQTGGHLHGIHMLRDGRGGPITTGPCSLHRGYFRTTAEANAEMDVLLDGASEDERARMMGLRSGTSSKGERAWKLVDGMGRTHVECHDDDVHGSRNAARFRTAEHADPLALWSPFLPVLLTCKRFYLESVGTIFRDLPPVLDVHNPAAAGFLHCENPHPSVRNLQTITLTSEDYRPSSRTPGGRPIDPNPPTERPAAGEGPSCAWKRAFDALARIDSLREIRISLHLGPSCPHAGDADLRPLAQCVGRLAAKVVVDLMRADDREVACRKCRLRPRTFILPAGNTSGGVGGEAGTPVASEPPPLPGAGGLECPPFGKVVWHAAPRYQLITDSFPPGPPVLKTLSRDLCLPCNRGESEDEPGRTGRWLRYRRTQHRVLQHGLPRQSRSST